MYEYLKFAPALTGSVFAVGSHFASLLSLAFLLGQHPVPAPAQINMDHFRKTGGQWDVLALEARAFSISFAKLHHGHHGRKESVRQSIE